MGGAVGMEALEDVFAEMGREAVGAVGGLAVDGTWAATLLSFAAESVEEVQVAEDLFQGDLRAEQSEVDSRSVRRSGTRGARGARGALRIASSRRTPRSIPGTMAATRRRFGDVTMASAALTPRVRTIVICDDINASSIEDGVFTLESVRCSVVAMSLPWRVPLSLYLLLSNPRPGRFPGKILIVDERTDKRTRLIKFTAEFGITNCCRTSSTSAIASFPKRGVIRSRFISRRAPVRSSKANIHSPWLAIGSKR